MPMSQHNPPAGYRGSRRRARTEHDGGNTPGLLPLALLPAAGIAVLGAALAAYLLAASRTPATTRIAVVAAAVAAAIILGVAGWQAAAATQRAHSRARALSIATARAQEELQRLQLQQQQQRHNSPQMTPSVPGDRRDQPVEVFVNVARRLQSLVHREIQLLDDLEGQVESPDLLKGLFMVDHLATRVRRQSESLAVLGGAVSRRQWNRPVPVFEVLRAAIAEVEQYSRAKVVPPVSGTLAGSAVADVIHLVAELVENATKFSPPETQVFVRTQNVTAGMVIEIEDRGLGMLPEDYARVNDLLSDVSRADPGELLSDGRIGLFVVSALGRRHEIKVQLQSNIYGGTQAVAVLPHKLIDGSPLGRKTAQKPGPAIPEPPRTPAIPEPPRTPAIPEPPRTPAIPAPPPAPAPADWGTSLAEAHPGPAVPWPPGPVPDQPPAVPWPPGSVPDQPPAVPWPPGPVPDQPPADSPAAPAGAPGAAGDVPPERPPLPVRRPQTHMAPQLQRPDATPRAEPAADLSPGLMAAFRGGLNRAEQEDDDAGGELPGADHAT
jgi:signal transduction histidine kinase